MTHLGAPKSGYHNFSLKALTDQTCRKHPRASLTELYSIVEKAFLETQEAEAPVYQYAATNFTNLWWNAQSDQPQSTVPKKDLYSPAEDPTSPVYVPPKPIISSERRAEIQSATRAFESALKVSVKEQMKLLRMIAPNGKTWGQCTKEEMIEFGGWCNKLAAGMRKGQTVGQRYTEAQVRAAQTWEE